MSKLLKGFISLILISFYFFSPVHSQDIEKKNPSVLKKSIKSEKKKKEEEKKKRDKIFLIGLAMLRLNWTDVLGDRIRFRYSDMGLPAEFSTRERASLMLDGSIGNGKYSVSGHLNYDPENRITEPSLDFFLRVGNDKKFVEVGDFRIGTFLDSVLSRYQHPFRGGRLGSRSKKFGIEMVGGVERGESGVELLSADFGSGPYYIEQAPVIRGSETVFLVVKSISNREFELKRTLLKRGRDYYFDYDRGEITLNESIYPYDEKGNPVFLEINFQYESINGKFTRTMVGFRSYFSPFKFFKLSLSYIADSNIDMNFEDAVNNRKGILTFGLNIDSSNVTAIGEFSSSEGNFSEKQYGFFGGGRIRVLKDLKFYFNSWSLDENFPTFANKQLQYGFSLFQIFPNYSDKNIFLSPFQFTRNLGAELYPFNLSQVSVNEKESHGYFEWINKKMTLSTGYGRSSKSDGQINNDMLYISLFQNREKLKFWGKLGLSHEWDKYRDNVDLKENEILSGLRYKALKLKKGDVYIQTDYNLRFKNDILNIIPDSSHLSYSLSTEYLTGREGVFASYQKERIEEKESGDTILEGDIFEVGIKNHVYKWLFVDARMRNEKGFREGGNIRNNILSLGLGFESRKFRALTRYEIQNNRQNKNEGRRYLWSMFFYGSPVKRMSLTLRYYKQYGHEQVPFSLTRQSEEQLNFRLLWRPFRFLSLFSHWRYDTNIDLYPPLDSTKSNSKAILQGAKLNITKKLEFLINRKLIKIWGPIENYKESYTAEMGYLIMRHFRLGVGVERIIFNDRFNVTENYDSTVAYLKLVAVF